MKSLRSLPSLIVSVNCQTNVIKNVPLRFEASKWDIKPWSVTHFRSTLEEVMCCLCSVDAGTRMPETTYYYSFKIFSRFWLVKTTRIIHHNQVLFTKFGKNLRHIESMTSKVEPSENYWTIDVKMTSKVQPAADYWTGDRENLSTRLCYIWWAEKRRAKWRNCFKNEKYFEWIIKQLLNSAFVGYEEFCRSRRMLSTSAFGLSG